MTPLPRSLRPRQLSSLVFLACSAPLWTVWAQAQTAGMELQGKVPVQPARSEPAALPVLPVRPSAAPAAPAGAPMERAIELTSVRIEGNQALSTAALLQHLGPIEGRRFTLAQLYELADQITAQYRAEGFPLAQAVVPAQRLAGGVLTIQVVEGVIGNVRAVGDDPKADGAQPILDIGVPVGAPVRSRSLERTMLLLDDQPGFRVRPVLKPGAQFGQTELEVHLHRRNRVSGEVGLDNTGNVNTGEYRLRAAVNLNSPWRFGDRLSLSALTTDRRLWLGSAEYETPLDARGTRGSVGLSRSSYELGGTFAALEARGVADTLSVRTSHAWLRSQQSNLLVSGTLAHKRLTQRFDALGLDRRRSSTGLNLALQFDRRDAWAGGGVVYGQVGLTAGRLTLDNASRELDAGTAQTDGGFTKVTLDLARIQKLPGMFSAYGRVSAQWSARNLDPSEKFAAGGFLGVRAYPLGEASGDRGWLAQTELRAALGSAATLFLAADAGRAELNAKPWDAGSADRRSIAGAGLGARWLQPGWSLESTLSWRTQGGRPEAESRDRNPRLFVIGSHRFE